ncbi:hypothetical protein HN615_13590 [Candidatus Woesearchaeota archaeon]|jgi:hypothetical protein|nr:hypothetical protein [Candidatus Woesearchaeota archaeon]
MVIVETQNEFSKFIEKYEKSSCIIIPVLDDVNKHPLDNSLCLLYIKIEDEDYILPFNHSEAINLDKYLLTQLNTDTVKYTYNKKELNHILPLKNVIDLNMNYYMSNNIPLDITEITTPSHDYFHRKYYKHKNINRIIPILQHLGYCRELVSKLESYKGNLINKNYNDDLIDNLTYIESSGLNRNNEIIYSEYNPYTSTGRPSNRFGGINFAALNKSDGSREPFTSRFQNGILVEYDYSAYHPSLIADMLGYKFSGDVYEHLGKYYGVDREESKILTFQCLYGHTPIEVIESNPFFKLVSDFINEMWKEYKNKEFIKSYIYSKKIYRKNLSDMNRNKLFNYFLQNLETEANVDMLSKLIPFIREYKSKLILYSYDSFLIDYNLNDGVEFLREVKKIIESNGTFPTSVSKGLNYNEMEDITEKL